MRSCRQFPATVQVLLIVCSCFVSLAIADNKKPNNNNRKQNSQNNRSNQFQRQQIQKQLQLARSQVTAAKKVLTDAKKVIANATQKLQVAESEIQSVAKDLDFVKNNSKTASENLRLLESQIEQSPNAGEEFARTSGALEKAKQLLEAERARVLESTAFKQSSREAARRDDNKTLVRLRDEALEGDTGYGAAREKLKQAEVAFSAARREALSKNPQWNSAAKDASDLRIELARGEQALKGKLIRRNNERSRLEKAKNVAKAAQAAIKHGGTTINRLESTQRRLNNSNQNNNRNKGKKKK